MTVTRSSALVVSCCLVLLTSVRAHAQDKVLAETLFQEGKALLKAGDYQRACPKLEESYRQDPSTGTLLALAMCQEGQGKIASAWSSFVEAAGRAQREASELRERAARQRAEALEARLPKLTVEVPREIASLPDLRVDRNGAELPKAGWGSPVPVDPGEYTIEVTAAGKQPWTERFSLAEAEEKKVVVGDLVDAPTTQTTPSSAGPAADGISGKRQTEPPGARAASMQDMPPRPQGPSPYRTIGMITAGVGVASLGVGGYFGWRAKSLDDQSYSGGKCDDATGCDDDGYKKRKDALRAGDLATGFAIGGAVATAVGVTLYFMGDSGSSGASTNVAISPMGLPDGAGVQVRGAL